MTSKTKLLLLISQPTFFILVATENKEGITIIFGWPTLIWVHNLQIFSFLTSFCIKTGGDTLSGAQAPLNLQT